MVFSLFLPCFLLAFVPYTCTICCFPCQLPECKPALQVILLGRIQDTKRFLREPNMHAVTSPRVNRKCLLTKLHLSLTLQDEPEVKGRGKRSMFQAERRLFCFPGNFLSLLYLVTSYLVFKTLHPFFKVLFGCSRHPFFCENIPNHALQLLTYSLRRDIWTAIK